MSGNTRRGVMGALLLSVAAYTAPAAAALMSVDLVSGSGDELLTLDPDTGLEWLDLTETIGMSYGEVSAQLAPGGSFEGFDFATADQVLTLMEDASIPDINSGAFFLDPTGVAAALAFQDLVGFVDVGSSPGFDQRSFGFTATVASGTNNLTPGVRCFYDFITSCIADTTVTNLDTTGPGNSVTGSWLVREEVTGPSGAVPEPSAVLVFAVGLAVIGAASPRTRL